MPAPLNRALILVHRYVGIPMSVVFVVWLASGIVMVYTGGMPALSEDERLAGLPALELEAVRVTPAGARTTAGFAPTAMRLTTVLGRPAWRLEARRGTTTVFADTGELLTEIDTAQARRVASRFTGIEADTIRHMRTVTAPDQWTLTLAGALPLMKLAASDAAGTQIYVSPHEGGVALVTDRWDRALAWAGAIPHWFYITPLRANQPLWYWSVVVTAVVGTVLAIVGLVLGITQLKPTRPFRLRASVPYSGWMHWHHVLGLVFGLFALTWVFSGLLSMEPLGWTRMDGVALGRGALGPDALDPGRFELPTQRALAGATAHAPLKELELREVLGAPYYVAHAAGAAPVLIDAATLAPRTRPFATEAIVARLEDAAPGHTIVEQRLLERYDSYYYARGGAAPLPVLRVKFDDRAATWVYADPGHGRVLARYNRRERLERWLYYGLHSLDFAFWYDRRPLWDLGMIGLSLGALATSGIGAWLGYRRIRRFVVRTTRARSSRAVRSRRRGRRDRPRTD